jgi:DNA gyrase subunit A
VVDDYKSYDLSIRTLLLEWIRYRREQKRVVINHKRTLLLGEQRTNDVKIFLLQGTNLEETVQIFKSSKNRAHLEDRLIERYYNTPIRMDSLQAKALSDMRMHELCEENYEKCLARRDEIIKELEDVNSILNENGGVDRVIIAELRDGVKRFGTDRKSSVVSKKISIETEIAGESVIQLSSDGNVIRRASSNIEDEPVPLDSGGLAVKVENDSSFVAIDEFGHHSFINVKELPVDTEVPLNRYIKKNLGRIVALLPFDIDSDRYCTLISSTGIIKKFKISEMRVSKRPCIDLGKGDKLVAGIVSRRLTHRDILIYTDQGFGQRLDPNVLRVTSYQSKGISGFKLASDDRIVGSYLIDPHKQYLLYVSARGKGRLNRTEYLPLRENKRDEMVRLINLGERDNLVTVLGCDKLDKVEVYYNDFIHETVKVNSLEEGTMSSAPIKIVTKPMTSRRIIKVKLI